MDVKERRPYCSLTKNRREKERRYTNSSADNEECRVPTQKSYSSSETLKAFDHDSSRLLYGNRVKDLVHREADEFSRQGRQVLVQVKRWARLVRTNLLLSGCHDYFLRLMFQRLIQTLRCQVIPESSTLEVESHLWSYGAPDTSPSCTQSECWSINYLGTSQAQEDAHRQCFSSQNWCKENRTVGKETIFILPLDHLLIHTAQLLLSVCLQKNLLQKSSIFSLKGNLGH